MPQIAFKRLELLHLHYNFLIYQRVYGKLDCLLFKDIIGEFLSKYGYFTMLISFLEMQLYFDKKLVIVLLIIQHARVHLLRAICFIIC